MNPDLNGVPSETPAEPAVARPQSRIEKLVARVRELVEGAKSHVISLQRDAVGVFDPVELLVSDPDLRSELESIAYDIEYDLPEVEEALDKILTLVERLGKRAEAAVARADPFIRTRKYRKEARDREIVRLHDECDKSFGIIALDLNMNVSAVEKAYHRCKNRQIKMSGENPDTSKCRHG